MDTLVTADWLAEHLDDPDLVVLDCSVVMESFDGGMRAVSGRPNYESGHIPAAVFADLSGDLCDTSSPHQFAVPTPEAFCESMGALGVGDGSRVVLYDPMMSMWASRVWWMLRWVGFDRAALLDGGTGAWTGAGNELTTIEPPPRSGVLTPNVRAGLIADQSEVRAAIDDDTISLVDSLTPESFSGEMRMYARAGHIPTAVNIPVFALFDDQGRFRSDGELAELHPQDRSGRTITYCGGGIAASAGAFAMTRLGFTDVAVYTASLQEWVLDADNPMVADV